MRVGIDIRCLSDGRRSGVEEYTVEILRSLFTIDPRNEYVLFLNAFSRVQADLSWIQRYSNVTVYRSRIPNKVLNFFLWYFRWPKIDRLIGGTDIFFVPNINFIALSKKTKCVLTVHDLSFALYPEMFSWKRRLWHFFVLPRDLCRRADRIVSVSRSTAQDLMTFFSVPSEKISVILSGVSDRYVTIDRNNPDLLKVKEKYCLPYRFILFLGTWEPRKNIETLVAAYNGYRESCATKNFFHLVLAGISGWQSRSLIHAVETSPYRDSIHLLGFIDDRDKTFLYNLAELFVYISHYEGFGFPVLEAMRCGTPVITSHASSLAEITDGGAVLVDPQRPDDVCRAIEEVLGDKTFVRFLSETGRRKAYGYRWELSGSALLEVFREVLGDISR